MKDNSFLLFIFLVLALGLLFGSLNSEISGYGVKIREIRCENAKYGVTGSFSNGELGYYCQTMSCRYVDTGKKVC